MLYREVTQLPGLFRSRRISRFIRLREVLRVRLLWTPRPDAVHCQYLSVIFLVPVTGSFASSGRHRNSASRRNRRICSRCRVRTSIPATSTSVMSPGMAISRLAGTVTACRKGCVASRSQYGSRWMMNCGSTVMSSRWHRTVYVRLHPAGRPCRSITPRSGSRSVRWNIARRAPMRSCCDA